MKDIQNAYFVIIYYFFLGYTKCEQFCNSEVFEGKCEGNEVILITKAEIGRMEIGKCVKTDFGYLGCRKDVMGIVDGKCSGRRKCSLRVADPELEKATTCNSEFKPYLELEYSCLSVISISKSLCNAPNKLRLTATSGYIANVFTEETGCGSSSTPWIVETSPGKIINFTLYNFNWQESDDNHRIYSNPCDSLAMIYEANASKQKKNVCPHQGERIKHVYRSLTNQVEVEILRKRLPDDEKHFLLHYEVIGCTDPPLRKGMQLERFSNKAVIKCTDMPKLQWTLTCSSNNQWSSTYGNCTAGGGNARVSHHTNGGDRRSWLPFSWDVSLALIAGVAFVICCCIFVGGLFVLRRRNTMEHRRQQQSIMLREAQDATFGKYPAYPDHTDPQFKIQPYHGDIIHQHPNQSAQHQHSNHRFSGGGGGQNSPIENEYAYVSEFPPPPSPKTLRMCGNSKELQQGVNKSGSGNSGVGCGLKSNSNIKQPPPFIEGNVDFNPTYPTAVRGGVVDIHGRHIPAQDQQLFQLDELSNSDRRNSS